MACSPRHRWCGHVKAGDTRRRTAQITLKWRACCLLPARRANGWRRRKPLIPRERRSAWRSCAGQRRHHEYFVSSRPSGSNPILSALPVILPQWATANRERQGALTESRTTIAGDPFSREWLCGAGQGCRGRILERLYIDNCLPLTVELFHQLAFLILSCKPISYCRFKRIDVYIL